MKNDLTIQFSSFDGPLDLLLSLIEEKKMGVSEVSISAVTEKFIEYLEKLEETNPEELADFLIIATKLLFLKSKHLLNSVTPEEDEGVALEDQLRLYRLFVEVSKKINERWLNPYCAYIRFEQPRIPKEIPLPENLTRDTWNASIKKLLERLKPPKALPETRIDRAVSLRDTIVRLKKLFEVERDIQFSHILGEKASKTEIIVSFLAILELVKQKEVELKQGQAFSDIHIAKLTV